MATDFSLPKGTMQERAAEASRMVRDNVLNLPHRELPEDDEEFVHNASDPACIRWGCWCLSYDGMGEVGEIEPPLGLKRCDEDEDHNAHYWLTDFAGAVWYCHGSAPA